MAQITLCYTGLSAFPADEVATVVGVHLNYLHAYEKSFHGTWEDEVKFSDVNSIVIEESYKSKMPKHLVGQFDEIARIDKLAAYGLRRTIMTKSILSIITFDIFDNIRSTLKVIDEQCYKKDEYTKFIDIESIHGNIEGYRKYTHSVSGGQIYQVEENLKKVLQNVLTDRFDDAAITEAELKARVEKGFRDMENGFRDTINKEYLDFALERLVKRLKSDAPTASSPAKAP